MRVGLTLVLLAHLLWTGVPLTRALVPGLPEADARVLGPGLALGAYTLLLGWIGWLPGAPLAGWGALAAWLAFAVAAHAFGARAADEPAPEPVREAAAPRRAVWLVIAAFTGGAALVNVYFPATHWDFLGRYGLQARSLFERGRWTAEVSGYPPMPALFACGIYAGCGEVVEELAKLQGPIHAVLLLALTARLAARPRRPWIARGAVLLVALSPVFLNSVPSGDPDLALAGHATACLYVLAARLPGPPARLAVLAGLELGFALMAKQAAGPFVVSLVGMATLAGAGWLAWGWLSARRLAAAVAVATLVAGPWYLRNVALTGQVFPGVNPGDIANADRSLASLAAPLRWWSELGAPGSPFLFLGLVALAAAAVAPAGGGRVVPARAAALGVAGLVALGELVAVSGHSFPPFDGYRRIGGTLLAVALWVADRPLGLSPPAAIGLIWLAPVFAAWWIRFAFTARYLLPVVPVLAAAGAAAGHRALAPAFRKSPAAWAFALPAAVLLTLEVYPLLPVTLARIAEQPRRTRDEKWDVYPGAVHRVAGWLARQPGARVGTNDGRLAYFRPLEASTTGLPAAPADLAALDWVVVAPFGSSMIAGAAEVRAVQDGVRALLAPRAPAYEEGGYAVYRVR